MLIKDLVHIDEHGAFRSDVQLSDYDNVALNRELLRNYIFTVSAPSTSSAGRDVSAKDVLKMLRDAFTLERIENRIVLTANFGRGKSHLALTLANFFSRPAESDEVRIIFERLGQALNLSLIHI
jgi:DNA replication protein DnaC